MQYLKNRKAGVETDKVSKGESPMGWLVRLHRLVNSSADATPSISANAASLIIGMRIRLTMNPA